MTPLCAPPPGTLECLENLKYQDAEKESLQKLEAKTLGWFFRINQAFVGQISERVGRWMQGWLLARHEVQ